MLATMSTGPVGLSDGAGNHNKTRLMRTCDADGTILQPNKPMTPIDATYRAILSASERPIPAAAVWQTYSHADGLDGDLGSYQYHLLGVDVKSDELPVMRDDFYPAIDHDTELIVRDWHRSAACVNGSDAVTSGCVTAVSDASSGVVTMGPGFDWPHKSPPEHGAEWHTTQLYTVTQSGGSTWVMLGELDKFTSVSSARFSKLQTSTTGIKASLRGGAGEVVRLTALTPDKKVVTADVKIGAGGTADWSCA